MIKGRLKRSNWLLRIIERTFFDLYYGIEKVPYCYSTSDYILKKCDKGWLKRSNRFLWAIRSTFLFSVLQEQNYNRCNSYLN
jgi:hypothetical protein